MAHEILKKDEERRAGLISQGLCGTTMTERFANPNCKCPTYPGNLGPCDDHEKGSNGRCVYCDHEVSCQPSVAAQGTDGLLDGFVNEFCGGSETVEQILEARLASHDAALLRQRDGEWVDEIEDRLHFGTLPPETLENTKGQLDIWLREHDAALKASVLHDAAEAAMEAFGHNETNLPHSEGCIACTVKQAILALAHTEKAAQ